MWTRLSCGCEFAIMESASFTDPTRIANLFFTFPC